MAQSETSSQLNPPAKEIESALRTSGFGPQRRASHQDIQEKFPCYIDSPTGGRTRGILDRVNFPGRPSHRGNATQSSQDEQQSVYFVPRTPKSHEPGLGSEEARLHQKNAEKSSDFIYTIKRVVSEGCFVPEVTLVEMLSRLASKKNIILQGPPGTGKTWLAKRLAKALIGKAEPVIPSNQLNGTQRISQLRAVQFHPNLSYEDFVRGWRPSGDGKLTLADGPFLAMVNDAKANPSDAFVIVIEEINRGNPASIFGELLTLLEADKRKPSEALSLCYREDGKGDEMVYIPENVHVIGTMNLADRSLAMVDLALRRRFAFFDLEPQFGDKWKDYLATKCDNNTEFVERVANRINALNTGIAADQNLGKQYRVGHSFLTPHADQPIPDSAKWYLSVVDSEIRPLLEEYYFDRPEEAKKAVAALRDGM